MTYTPKEWETGDIIGATDLNNIENGITSLEAMKLEGIVDGETVSLNYTWQEINDAMGTKLVYYIDEFEELSSLEQVTKIITSIGVDEKYTVQVGSLVFKSSTADGTLVFDGVLTG